VKWFRRRSRHLRRLPAGGISELREFVYLDEVSVFSLAASRFGALEAEFTQSESESLMASLDASVSASAPLLLQSEIRSGVETTSGRNSQVLKKATIQSTFGRLLEEERKSLALLIEPGQAVPRLQDAAHLLNAFDEGRLGSAMIAHESLRRGRLTELDVELEPESVFKFQAIMGEVFQLAEGMPQLMTALATSTGAQQAAALYPLLDRLLAGLVPLRGRSVSFKTVQVAGRSFVIRNDLLDAVVDPSGLGVDPLEVVGVAEAGLFWKDIRRVLFGGLRYRMLCRIARDSLQPTWSPVKPMDVLGEISPGIRSSWDAAMTGLDTSMRQEQLSAPASSESDASAESMRRAMIAYCRELASNYGSTYEEAELQRLGVMALLTPGWASVSDTRRAFTDAADLLAVDMGVEIDKAVARQTRDDVLRAENLDAMSLTASELATPPNRDLPSKRPHFLDCEIVAIYW
jgi:hypothetical protein